MDRYDGGTKFDPKSDYRSGFERFTPENLEANMAIVDLLKRVGERRSATPAQVALAWLMAQKPWIVSIPGTRNMNHLKENLGALDVQLTPEELRELETGFSKFTVHGGRLSETFASEYDPAV